ncbi:hypothetical protein QUF18_19705 [Pseudochrobactrum kiredjianiae]|nr:hypothetical protein [Pseudochrobactrum kiredjianiae]MDM7853207.1 hypothetical protein [Pseudochrobactrum kiredjianiae]
MIEIDATFRHHFLQIAQAQIVSQVPPDTQQNDGFIKMATFKHLKYSAD